MFIDRRHAVPCAAEEEGFEPPEDGKALVGFQNRFLRPLGHSSKLMHCAHCLRVRRRSHRATRTGGFARALGISKIPNCSFTPTADLENLLLVQPLVSLTLATRALGQPFSKPVP